MVQSTLRMHVYVSLCIIFDYVLLSQVAKFVLFFCELESRPKQKKFILFQFERFIIILFDGCLECRKHSNC